MTSQIDKGTDGQTSEPQKLGWVARLWACVLSLIFPGMGQALRGAYGRALVLAVTAVLTIAIVRYSVYAWPWLPSRLIYGVILIAALAVLSIAIFSAIDAFRFNVNRKSRFRIWWKRWLVYLGILAVLGLRDVSVVGDLHWQTFSIPSLSMEPTILVGDWILAVDGYYETHKPQRGDIVVFYLPCDFPLLDSSSAAVYRRACNSSVEFDKRIVGLPGDQIQLTHGVLYINDEPVSREDSGAYIFTSDLRPKTFQKYRETLSSGYSYEIALSGDDGVLENTDIFTVPAGHYFVLGDNRDNSVDTREPTGGVGFVPEANLLGRMAFVTFASNGSGKWWQFWMWPSVVRWGRLGMELK
jgi:signal peptidase I